MQTRVFRPTKEAWLGRVILPGTFLLVLAVTAFNLAALNPGLMWLILALLPSIGLVGGAYAIPIIFGRIIIDQMAINANVDGMRLKLFWRDVRAAQIVVQDHEPYLMLGVSSGLYVLPLRHFTIMAVWEAVQQAAGEGTVRPEAFEQYERKDANEGIPPDLWMVGVLHVADHRGLSIAAALGVAGFLLLFVITLITHESGAEVYLAFSVLYLLVLTGIGTTELDPKGITRRTLLGTNRILWDELSAVETGPFSLRIVLEGMRGQRMVLFGPPMWAGLDAVRAVHFFALQISTRRLPRRRSITALFKISRNTQDDISL
ncbi:MAG: hypothetical protein IH586_19455 [Anaerolineaceae bacterium]|nr:hypothetical protein [Anaerolineaceae bacterium]